MKSYFGNLLEVSPVADSPSHIRLSIKSSDFRVDEYIISRVELEFLFANASSLAWESFGMVSIKSLGDTHLYLRLDNAASSSPTASVYVVSASDLQVLSGQYLSATRP